MERTATLIARARAEAVNSILVDNGDFLQGTPLERLTFGSGWDGPHPAIAAMNTLGYDAAALGNHEFNFGLDVLDQAIAAAEFPILAANIAPAGPKTTPAARRICSRPYALLPRDIVDMTGTAHRVTIGVIGLLPPQITVWDHDIVQGEIVVEDIVVAASRAIPEALTAGADLVVLLAHTGIGSGKAAAGAENCAEQLGLLPSVAAIVAGHQHLLFPDPSFERIPLVDARLGRLGSTPAVMPGAWGSHVGLIDLDLEFPATGGVIIVGASVELRPIAERTAGRIAALVPADPAVADVISSAHQATLRLMDEPIARTDQSITSHLALIGDQSVVRLVNAAQRWYVRTLMEDRLLENDDLSSLPLLSVASAFKVGGFGGPDNFTAIPAGPLTLRHVSDLYGFPNRIEILEIDGATLKLWLERSASVFARLALTDVPQPLLDDRSPPPTTTT